MPAIIPRTFFAVTLALAPGCDGKSQAPSGLVPAEGIVTLDQTPLAGVVVTFASESEEGPSASGISDALGRFRLTSFPSGDGARPGSYRVVVIKRVAGAYSAEPAATPADPRAVPAIYGAATATPLRATVPADRPIAVELKSTP
jgi:hypothetical protein